MMRHLVRLMWNRKRQNVLLMLEIFVAFLVTVAVAVLLTHFGVNSRRPLGFTIDRVWNIDVGRNRERGESAAATAADRDVYRRVLAEIDGLVGVEVSAAAFTGPYRPYSWSEMIHVEGHQEMLVSINRVDDDFRDVLGLQLLAGRWFSPEDAGAAWDPVVVNRSFVDTVYGGKSPVGEFVRELPVQRPGPRVGGPRQRKRIVGVVEEFRQFGELSTPAPVIFYRGSLEDPAERLQLPEVVLIRVAPGTTAAFEETLVRRLAAVAPAWSFGVKPVEALRESMLRENLVPLATVTATAAALMLMVALGLSGVVWQNVTERMREFGLRRAQGATAAAIRGQVVGELVVVTSFAVATGLVLIAQIPLIPFPPDFTLVPRAVFLAGLALAIAAVYGVTILCAWYPSRLATRTPPAEALHYE